MVWASVAVAASLSVAVKVTVLSSVLGVSLLLLKVTARATPCTNALVALVLKVSVQAVLLLTDAALAVPISVVPAISLLPVASSQIALFPASIIGSDKLSVSSPFAVICTFSEPPFQSALPSRSVNTISFTTATGVCSVNEVAATAVELFNNTESLLLPLFAVTTSSFPSLLTSMVITARGASPVLTLRFAVNVPSPLFNNTERVSSFSLVTNKSSALSPFMSATVTERGLSPT